MLLYIIKVWWGLTQSPTHGGGLVELWWVRVSLEVVVMWLESLFQFDTEGCSLANFRRFDEYLALMIFLDNAFCQRQT